MDYKDEELEELMRGADERAHNGQLERLRFLLSRQDPNPAPVDTLAHEYFEEARLCWYVGAFVATIVMSQLALEEMLRAHYRRWKGVDGKLNEDLKVDEASFLDLISQAEADGWLSSEEAALLNKIRKDLRNPYVHPHDLNTSNVFAKPNWLRQLIKITASQLAENGAEDEARQSISALVELFPTISRRLWGMK
ncbi:hypothetical protein M1N05_01105 [Dehalococcoidales bacterium]|nr:hypothetical protein [Dehalococcoidales bacterium]